MQYKIQFIGNFTKAPQVCALEINLPVQFSGRKKGDLSKKNYCFGELFSYGINFPNSIRMRWELVFEDQKVSWGPKMLNKP